MSNDENNDVAEAMEVMEDSDTDDSDWNGSEIGEGSNESNEHLMGQLRGEQKKQFYRDL